MVGGDASSQRYREFAASRCGSRSSFRIDPLQPDFTPIHQLTARAIAELARAKTFFIERLAVLHDFQRDGGGQLPHDSGLLVDQAIDAIADLGLAATASHHFVADAQASIAYP